MAGDEKGYFQCFVGDAKPGDTYWYALDDVLERPDPASRFQPEGVHGPSMVIDPHSFAWTDGSWRGRDLADYVIYELHVGTFTAGGRFEDVVTRLPYLKDLGVTAVELMPVGQFPGWRNWGYDGVYPFAPQNSYGGPDGLKRLIDGCHEQGLAVILDVVYNHLGPEGNYLHDFGPYFTDRYRTPWGDAVNFDGPHSDEVRRYFVKNACYWVSEYHVDALRLDAVHGIFDFGAYHILRELAEEVHGLATWLGRRIYMIAESDLNDVRLITPPSLGGYGLDGQWNDDFHHSLHALLTGERSGYYADFGRIDQMAGAVKEGFVYSGGYSRYRRRSHGSSSARRPAVQFVQFSQNHDQVGNRPEGDRPRTSGNRERLKLAAAAVLLCPGIPLLFMGEEYGETAPFRYFVDHSDQELADAVKKGREMEHAVCGWSGDAPDPCGEQSFFASKIDPGLAQEAGHREVLAFYKEVLRLRRTSEVLRRPTRKGLDVRALEDGRVLVVRRRGKREDMLALFNLSDGNSTVEGAMPPGKWRKILDSSSTDWGGPGELAARVVSGGPTKMTVGSYGAVLYRGMPFEEVP
jgi:maltooligosyltrehalose trehalohydrolase